jgi:hypothetical protein
MTTRVKIDLDDISAGAHLPWPGFSAELEDGGGNPDTAATKFRLKFVKKDGTEGCVLSTDSGDTGAILLTLSDGASWTVDAQEIPASEHELTPGDWLWDAEITLTGGVIRKPAYGVLTVHPSPTAT